jgi:hypothetical protein
LMVGCTTTWIAIENFIIRYLVESPAEVIPI